MLVDEIRAYQAICDESCHEYKDQRVKKNVWQALADALKIDVASTQQRYNNIWTKKVWFWKRWSGNTTSYKYLRWLCLHIKHSQTCTIHIYRWNGWKLCQFDLHFAAIWVHWQSIADASATHLNRLLKHCQLEPATTQPELSSCRCMSLTIGWGKGRTRPTYGRSQSLTLAFKQNYNQPCLFIVPYNLQINWCELESIIHRILPKPIADTVRPTGSRLAHLYGLPKTHKDLLAMRPILSATQTYNYALAKWLDTKLKPLSLNRYTVTDIFEFANEIRYLEIANGDILVSYDGLPCLLTYP